MPGAPTRAAATSRGAQDPPVPQAPCQRLRDHRTRPWGTAGISMSECTNSLSVVKSADAPGTVAPAVKSDPNTDLSMRDPLDPPSCVPPEDRAAASFVAGNGCGPGSGTGGRGSGGTEQPHPNRSERARRRRLSVAPPHRDAASTWAALNPRSFRPTLGGMSIFLDAAATRGPRLIRPATTRRLPRGSSPSGFTAWRPTLGNPKRSIAPRAAEVSLPHRRSNCSCLSVSWSAPHSALLPTKSAPIVWDAVR
jgi:hypothetical protein